MPGVRCVAARPIWELALLLTLSVALASCSPGAIAPVDTTLPTQSTVTLTSVTPSGQPTLTASATWVPAADFPTQTPVPETPTAPASSPPAPPSLADRSKLGIHGIWPNHILDFTQALADAGAPFRIIKAVDDLSWLKEVRRISPETITVGRLTHYHESAALIHDPGTDLDWYAAVLMEPILERIQDDPSLGQAVDYWELTNEPLGGGVSADAYVRLAQVTMLCMEIAEANGLKLAIFGFNAGTPEWSDMLAILDTGVFGRAKAGDHILAVHEGVFGNDPIDKWWNVHFVDGEGNPTTEDTGVTAPGGWIPGAPVVAEAGALCLRYRFLYQLLGEQGAVIPLFVSEFYAGGGYDPASKADVIARMRWYDEQVSADDYVLGFAPFTLGPTPDWNGQDYEQFYAGEDGLVTYAIARATSVPSP